MGSRRFPTIFASPGPSVRLDPLQHNVVRWDSGDRWARSLGMITLPPCHWTCTYYINGCVSMLSCIPLVERSRKFLIAYAGMYFYLGQINDDTDRRTFEMNTTTTGVTKDSTGFRRGRKGREKICGSTSFTHETPACPSFPT